MVAFDLSGYSLSSKQTRQNCGPASFSVPPKTHLRLAALCVYKTLATVSNAEAPDMGKTSSRSEASTRADQKFEKKIQFYAKVRDTVASLGAQKAIGKKKKLRSRQRKLKAYDLSSLSEFLPDPKNGSKRLSPASEFKLNSKSRQSLILKEGNQLRTVLEHPAFQSNPLAAIHQHLLSTQPSTDEKPVKKHGKSGKKRGKGKKSKASTAPQSMEM